MLGLPPPLGPLDLKLAERDLQRLLVADFDKIADAHAEPLSEEAQRSERRVTFASFQFAKETERQDVARGFFLGESRAPASLPDVLAYQAEVLLELHPRS